MNRVFTTENRKSAITLILLGGIGVLWGLLVLGSIPLSLGTLLGALCGCAIAVPFIACAVESRWVRLGGILLFTLGAFVPTLALYFREVLTFPAWLKSLAILILFSGSIGGIASFLRWLGVKPALAGMLTTVLAMMWLSWPIWMAPRLKGEHASRIAQKLVDPNPVFVLNARLGKTNALGEFTPAFEVPWAEHRIAYQLTNLGDDVAYRMPRTVWPMVWTHAAGLLGLFCRGTVRQLGAYGKAGFLGALGATLPIMGMLIMILAVPFLAPALKNAGWLGAMFLILLFFALGGFALIPTWTLSGLAGWVYGAPMGFVVALTAMSGASVVAYEFAVRFAADDVVKKIQDHPKLGALHDALIGKSLWKTLVMVILIRIPSSSPFSLTNYLLACAKVPRKVYLPGSLIGLTPRTLLVVIMSSRVQKYSIDPSRGEAPILISLTVLVAALGALVWIARSTLRNITTHETR